MSDPTFLVKIGDTDLTSYLRAPEGYKVQRAKLWSDAGRAMNGTLRATYIGLFPKILLNFRNLSYTEMKTICGLLDDSSFTVTWWDAESQSTKSGTYYAGDFDVSIMNLSKSKYEPFVVSLVPFSKLT